MKNCLFIIIVSIFLFSCVQHLNPSSDSIDNYKLNFSQLNKLERMKVGRLGMGYTTDGTYLYAVNGSYKGAQNSTGIGNYKVTQYGEHIYADNQNMRQSIFPHTLVRYNVTSDQWSILPNKLIPKRWVSAENIDGNIYIFNGQKPNGLMNKKVEVVELRTGKVDVLNDNPFPTAYAGSAVWKNKIYVFGGSINNKYYSNKIRSYNIKDDSWTDLGDMPKGMQTRGEIIDGILYVFGGYNGISSSKIHSYDIINNTWEYIGDMPLRISANAITKNKDFIYLVGDYNKLSFLGIFNVRTKEFHLIKSNMFGRRHAGAEIISNKLYVYGGNRQIQGNTLSSIQVADITKIENLLSQE